MSPGGALAALYDGWRAQLIATLAHVEAQIDFPEEDLATCTVENPEELEILGHKISCTKLRVERTDRKSKKTTRDFEWYAEGIGLVQVTVTVMKMTQTFTLASYTPAGESRE